MVLPSEFLIGSPRGEIRQAVEDLAAIVRMRNKIIGSEPNFSFSATNARLRKVRDHDFMRS
jgi:hypothetical protein